MASDSLAGVTAEIDVICAAANCFLFGVLKPLFVFKTNRHYPCFLFFKTHIYLKNTYLHCCQLFSSSRERASKVCVCERVGQTGHTEHY